MFDEETARNLFETEPIAHTLQRFIIRLWQNSCEFFIFMLVIEYLFIAAIMYIHRRYLVQAMNVNARAPTQTAYAQSVFAAYDAACKQIRDLLTLYGARPQLVSRMHPYWSHAFSAAVSVLRIFLAGFSLLFIYTGNRSCWALLRRVRLGVNIRRTR